MAKAMSLTACRSIQSVILNFKENNVSTIMLYGCRYADDIENIVILTDEKNNYIFEGYVLDGMYKVKTRLPGNRALSDASIFIHCGMHTLRQTVLRKISDATGKTTGYELKPLLYEPWEFNPPEVLLSSLVLRDSKVTAYFSLDPSVKRGNGPTDRLNGFQSY